MKVNYFLNSLVECSKYTFLNESNRAMTYVNSRLGNLLDSKLSGWYRFSGGAGTQIAMACPSHPAGLMTRIQQWRRELCNE